MTARWVGAAPMEDGSRMAAVDSPWAQRARGAEREPGHSDIRALRSSGELSYALPMLRPFWTLLRDYPQIPAELLDECASHDNLRRIPIASALQLLDAAVAATGDPDLGLRAARLTETGAFDALEYAAATASTWREALLTACRYAQLMDQAADVRLEVIGDKAHLILHSKVPLPRAAVDFRTAAFHITVARWLPELPSEVEAWFTHTRPADITQYELTLPMHKLVFSAPWNGFVFDAAHLDTPLASSDRALHRILCQHAEQLVSDLVTGTSLVEQVRGYIQATLRDGPIGAADTAARMRITRRTLTRRLKQEGTSFTALLEDVRRRTATHYLQTTDRSVEDIAFLLGFSESSPFVRAFKRWTGMAPLAYRRLHRR